MDAQTQDHSTDAPETFLVHAKVDRIENGEATISADGSSWTAPVADIGDAAAGESIDVFVDIAGAKPFVSRRMGEALRLLETLSSAFADKRVLEAEVLAVVKGGLSLDLGLRAFMPASQTALRPVENLAAYVGQKLRVRIIELDEKRGRVVVSHRALLEEERVAQRDALLKTLHSGDKVSGTVVAFVGHGAIVDIGGMDGLLRLEDMSWGHVRHGSQLFAIGDTIEVKVLELANEKARLGVKQLTPDPWGEVPSKYPVGSKHSAKVLRLADFGAFVELEPNVEGLVHVSEMRWGKSVNKPGDVVQKGQTVDVQVLDIDTSDRRIALGMRQLTANPWAATRDKYPRGARLSGTVRSITDFGAFLALDTGIDGLVHASDMSWSERVRPADRYKVGDVVEVVMLDVNVEAERVALGVKQLTEDPWLLAVGAKPVGTKFTGKVMGVTDFGAFVELAPSVQGLVHVSELTEDRDARPADLVKVGDELNVVVQDIDEGSRRIELSALAYDRDDSPAPAQPAFTNSTMAEKLSKMKVN